MPMNSVKFLLVDDLEENLLSLAALLRHDALEVYTARSGQAALELLLVHEFALAIIDVQMPEMDGFELADLMRGTERTRHVPIIFLTAADGDTWRRFRGYESGAVDFLFKPVEPQILRSKASVFTNLYRQRQEITQQRDALRESEERFRAVQQTSPDGFMIFRSLRDASGNIEDFVWEYSNPASERMVQRTHEQLMGRRLLEEMPGNRAEGLFAAYVKVVETGVPWQREFQYNHDQINYWFRSTAAKVGDGFAVSFADITNSKRSEQALRDSEERLRLAMQAGRTGVWNWSLATGVVEWSEETYQIFGVQDKAFRGTLQALLALVHPDDREHVQAGLFSAIEGQERYQSEFRILRGPRGQVRHVTSLGLVRVAVDGAVSVVGTITDVTEQREAERALRQREAELQSLSDNSPNIIARFDHRRRHVFVNATIERYTGLKPAAFLGKTNRELGMPDALCSQWEQAIDDVFQTGTPHRIDFYYRSPEGERRFESQLIPEPQLLGSAGYVLAVTRDVTVEWKATEELNRAKEAAELANKAKDNFLAVVSHELRTPMTAILGYTDIVLERTTDNELLEYLRIVRQNGDYLLEIINDILDLSKIEASKLDVIKERLSPVSVVEDIRRTMEMRALEKGLTLRVKYDSQLPAWIESDSKRLKQILINLVGNAIKFTRQGSVVLSVAYDTGSRMYFRITDTGIGMSEEQMTKLFKPFSQGDSSVSRVFGGTGLGLAISKRLAKMLGGEIEVSSTLGVGTTFSLILDIDESLVAEDIGPPKLSRRDESIAGGQLDCNVLIVDDRRDIRFLTKRLLTKAGASVEELEDGQLALDYVQRCMHDNRCPDLVLLDMQMPVLDGYSTAKQLRLMGFDRPIIALTGDAMQDDRNRCIECGCTSYLSKPIDASRLIGMVAELTRAADAV